MHIAPTRAALTPSALVFPLALVLFEFAVYIANDMVQPAMLAVTRDLGVDSSWVPTSMTAFLLGGALLPWLMGPLSDRIGRRPVMLWGVALFIVSCLAMLSVHSITGFIALRLMQGMGLCFISAVGYACLQEAFAEKAAVKVTALMANVALLAPLAGPLAGAALIRIWPWQAGFIVIAALSGLALVGLWFSMPETVQRDRRPLELAVMLRTYRALLGNRRFMSSTLCIPLLALPLMGWVAISPLMLVEACGLSTRDYSLCQLPVFGGLILGNLALVHLTERWPLGLSVKVGALPVVAGMALLLAGSGRPLWMVTGMSVMAFGEGLAFAVLYRFALTATAHAKGCVAAGMAMLCMLCYASGIEMLRRAYLAAGIAGFAAVAMAFALLFCALALPMVNAAMAERAPAPVGA
ncbi:MFS transporter [Paludibacterium yongneupense]|uniref:MFS transporter n=1 Tax=Paludibacterium yongneupense TaxID=400061 RepID=UPI00041430FA|nr:MFS transporter [Paludibacterium yongneupense]